MKYLRIAGLCLVALLLMSAATAATALAGPVWQKCEKGASGTKFATEECGEASGTGEWAWAEIKGTEKSIGRGSLLLKDESVVTVEVGCTLVEEGSFGPGKYSRVEVATYKCTAGKNCEEFQGAEAKNLPWQEEMYETEKAIFDKISGKSEKEPDLTVSCKVLGTKLTDEINLTKVASQLTGSWSWFRLFELLELTDIGRPGELAFGSTAWLIAPPGPAIGPRP